MPRQDWLVIIAKEDRQPEPRLGAILMRASELQMAAPNPKRQRTVRETELDLLQSAGRFRRPLRLPEP
jgi:hypothetical protein